MAEVDSKVVGKALRTAADIVDPPASAPTTPPTTPTTPPTTPTTPPTTPTTPGSGGTVISDSGFPGSLPVDTNLWVPAFEDNFPNLAAKGAFLPTYSKWGAYPSNYFSTDKSGNYEPKNISVIDVKLADGSTRRVMDCEMRPASMNGNTTWNGVTKQRPSGCAPTLRFGSQGNGATLGEVIETCFRIVDGDGGYHMANLGWPLNDSDWPEKGENDFIEMDLDSTNIGCFLHLWDATEGNDQIHFGSGVNPQDGKFHVVRFERIPGNKSADGAWRFKWFVDGVQKAPDNATDLKNRGYLDSDGKTIKKRVPQDYFRPVFQNEPGGNPSKVSHVQYDWVRVWQPKAA